MDRLRRTQSWLITAAFCVAIGCGIAIADGPSTVPVAVLPQKSATSPNSTGVLVLHDGGVLSGAISRSGDRYLLRREGGEIEVAASKVAFVGGSLLEAYDDRRTRALQPAAYADAHLSLADWCLRNNLLPQAARELLDARGLAPDHPRIALLERRLASASAPRPPRPQPVRRATALEAVPASEEPHDATLPIEELPAGAVERFTRRVQPILVNNCTAAGCHQLHGRQSFQLDRALLRGLANRRSTQRNLAATLTLVDRSQPHLSALLTVSRRVHGGMREPVFGPRQAVAYSHLVEWVRLVTQIDSEAEQPAAALGETDEAFGDETQSDAPIAAGVAHSPELGMPLQQHGSALQAAGREALRRPPRFGAQLSTWQPKDEFDPEIFNRQQRTPVAVGPAEASPPAIAQ